MESLTTTGKQEKNALSNAGAWILLVDFDMTPTGWPYHYRFTSDNQITTWKGNTYYVIPMELGDMQESLKGEIPSLMLQISNAERTLGSYTQNWGGMLDTEVMLSIVHSAHLNASAAEIEEVFTIMEAAVDAEWLTFTLGMVSPLTRRFPRDRYISTMCRHIFKGALCRYTGAYTDCNHTLADCGLRDNISKYGGSPGVSEGIIAL